MKLWSPRDVSCDILSNQFGFKKSWCVDGGTDEEDDGEVFKHSKVGVRRMRVCFVWMGVTHWAISEIYTTDIVTA